MEGGEPAFVAPPIGAREPRPVIVAVHGAGDRPEWACGGWRLASRAHGFVVCPRGAKYDATRFAWSSPEALRMSAERALAALERRYAPYIVKGPALYAAFSQGAIYARDVLLAKPGRFAAVVLAEGGYDLIRSGRFRSDLVAAGTTRLVVVCGGGSCFERAERTSRSPATAGLELIVAGDPRSGHNLNERMQRALRGAWPSVVRGLAGWESYRPDPD